jgi:carboxymethylenebutenolidase
MESNEDGISRRDFAALSVAAMLVAAAGPADAAAPVTETDVVIETADGHCDAAFFHPTNGRHPAVLIWTDAFGLRPAFREMGRRLATAGYAVLVPNPFYRTNKAPVLADVSDFDFRSAEGRARMATWTTSINQPGAAERDAAAFVAWLDRQNAVDPTRRVGTKGYCMGGPLVFRTTAALPDRVGAGATFHGGGLVAPGADSPHLLIPKMKGTMLIVIAGSDDRRQPDAKDVLRSAFMQADVPARVEVYADTIHGWCVRDMPLQDGKPIFNPAEADRAWSELLGHYKAALRA